MCPSGRRRGAESCREGAARRSSRASHPGTGSEREHGALAPRQPARTAVGERKPTCLHRAPERPRGPAVRLAALTTLTRARQRAQPRANTHALPRLPTGAPHPQGSPGTAVGLCPVPCSPPGPAPGVRSDVLAFSLVSGGDATMPAPQHAAPGSWAVACSPASRAGARTHSRYSPRLPQ